MRRIVGATFGDDMALNSNDSRRRDDPAGHLYIVAQRRCDDLATLCVAASMHSCRRDDPLGRLTSIDVDTTIPSVGTMFGGNVHCVGVAVRRRDDPPGHLYIAEST